MIIVGFNGFSNSAELFARAHGRTGRDRYRLIGHDASAAVVINGHTVAAVEEERLNRVKKTSDFPHNALRWCLDRARVPLSAVDAFAFPWDFSDEIVNGWIDDVSTAPLTPAQKFERLGGLAELHQTVISRSAIHADFLARTGFDIPADKLILVPHHVAHLMCGYAIAGRPNAAFLVSDGGAERTSAIMGEVRAGKVRIIEDATIPLKDSLGRLYSDVTRYLGFVPNSDEYKVMGMAAYAAEPAHNPFLDQIIKLESDGRYTINNPTWLLDEGAYNGYLDNLLGGHEEIREQWDFRIFVARAVQTAVEVVTEHQIRALQEQTDLSRLILEGGVALNCVNNTRLLQRSRFTELDVSFGASDVGLAIGAAHWADIQLRGVGQWQQHGTTAGAETTEHRPASTPYVGPTFDDSEVLSALAQVASQVSWRRYDESDIAIETAKILADKVVVGWVQGPAEFGPRALGARSILANPAYPDIKDIINTRVKHREPFRPFAPMVLAEDAAEVFDMGKRESSPFMTFVFPVHERYRTVIPGACHVDGSSRIQTVCEDQAPLLADLLRAFKAGTGVPCLLNTSFNVAGEPIVCTPMDALNCFLATEIDYLVIGSFIVSKQRAGD